MIYKVIDSVMIEGIQGHQILIMYKAAQVFSMRVNWDIPPRQDDGYYYLRFILEIHNSTVFETLKIILDPYFDVNQFEDTTQESFEELHSLTQFYNSPTCYWVRLSEKMLASNGHNQANRIKAILVNLLIFNYRAAYRHFQYRPRNPEWKAIPPAWTGKHHTITYP